MTNYCTSSHVWQRHSPAQADFDDELASHQGDPP